jgi:hypothetical protein
MYRLSRIERSLATEAGTRILKLCLKDMTTTGTMYVHRVSKSLTKHLVQAIFLFFRLRVYTSRILSPDLNKDFHKGLSTFLMGTYVG